jgi:hypothetical protein
VLALSDAPAAIYQCLKQDAEAYRRSLNHGVILQPDARVPSRPTVLMPIRKNVCCESMRSRNTPRA